MKNGFVTVAQVALGLTACKRKNVNRHTRTRELQSLKSSQNPSRYTRLNHTSTVLLAQENASLSHARSSAHEVTSSRTLLGSASGTQLRSQHPFSGQRKCHGSPRNAMLRIDSHTGRTRTGQTRTRRHISRTERCERVALGFRRATATSRKRYPRNAPWTYSQATRTGSKSHRRERSQVAAVALQPLSTRRKRPELPP